jgi:hypothetical protein
MRKRKRKEREDKTLYMKNVRGDLESEGSPGQWLDKITETGIQGLLPGN